jgi:hypothetical protein
MHVEFKRCKPGRDELPLIRVVGNVRQGLSPDEQELIPPGYLHPYSQQRRLINPCRTGLAIGSVIYASQLLIVVTSDVFIACLASCRNGYPIVKF